MAKLNKTINANDVLKDVTLDIEITGLKVLTIRVWLATFLMNMAAKVLGCGINIKNCD